MKILSSYSTTLENTEIILKKLSQKLATFSNKIFEAFYGLEIHNEKELADK